MIEFKTALLDPPWKESGGGKIKRGADKHYDLLSKEKIRDVILNSNVWNISQNAHCYLWVTNNHLVDGLWLMNEIGFRYVTNICWSKIKENGQPYKGLGQYFRGSHELCLFGAKGKGKSEEIITSAKDIGSCLPAKHTKINGKIKHSSKPIEFYDLIEKRSKGPYLEMFARNQPRNEQWTVFGNEI